MASEEGKKIYKDRAATSETVNADLRTYRGLGPLTVAGWTRSVRGAVVRLGLQLDAFWKGITKLNRPEKTKETAPARKSKLQARFDTALRPQSSR